MNYKFERMYDGKYQVRLQGEFVCYSNHKDEKLIDCELKDRGFKSRLEFWKYCGQVYEEKSFNSIH